MNTTKTVNQHYIPQFYLRNFSVNHENRINVFSLKTNEFNKMTPIKKQASGEYYYGEDGVIEGILQALESKQARLIKRIFEGQLPKRKSVGERDLYELFATTHIRNPVIVEYFGNMSREAGYSDVYKVLGEGSLEKHAKEMGFKHLNTITNYLVDLDYKVLVNNTENSFITSDLPVVRYNKYLELYSNTNNTIAYSISGFKMFLPLSANMCLLLFDSKTYKIGNKKDRFVTVNCGKEVDQINLLQVLSCESKIYFNEKVTEAYIKKLVATSRKKRYADLSKSSVRKGEFLVTERCVNIKMNIPFIKIHSNAKRNIIVSNEGLPLRNAGF